MGDELRNTEIIFSDYSTLAVLTVGISNVTVCYNLNVAGTVVCILFKLQINDGIGKFCRILGILRNLRSLGSFRILRSFRLAVHISELCKLIL